MELQSRVPVGPLEQKRDIHRRQLKLVSPADKRKLRMNVVGPGLAGSSAAASLAEIGLMDAEGFGGCTNTSDCEAACPKESSVDCISEMNPDYFRAALNGA